MVRFFKHGAFYESSFCHRRDGDIRHSFVRDAFERAVFDPLFAAPAVAAGVATGIAAGAVGTAAGVATGGYYGSPYYNGYNSGYGYGDGYPTYFGAGSSAPGYDTGFYFDTPTYGAAPTYAPSYTQTYVDQPQPIRTGRSAARRNYKSGRDNPYQ